MLSKVVSRGLGCFLILVVLGFASFAQTTISTGSIQGTLTDPSGAAVAAAKITITNRGTGQKINLASNNDGLYNSVGLIPCDYVVRI